MSQSIVVYAIVPKEKADDLLKLKRGDQLKLYGQVYVYHEKPMLEVQKLEILSNGANK